jgi:hypothetical protein
MPKCSNRILLNSEGGVGTIGNLAPLAPPFSIFPAISAAHLLLRLMVILMPFIIEQRLLLFFFFVQQIYEEFYRSLCH